MCIPIVGMKALLFLIAMFWGTRAAQGSLSAYPEKKKPAVSLIEACQLGHAMLETQGDSKKYHIIAARLYGDEKQSGDGGWTIYFYDKRGNQAWAFVPLRNNFCRLSYYPHDRDKRGGDRRVSFSRSGTRVFAAPEPGTVPPAVHKRQERR
jgi:hypothetical protein